MAGQPKHGATWGAPGPQRPASHGGVVSGPLQVAANRRRASAASGFDSSDLVILAANSGKQQNRRSPNTLPPKQLRRRSTRNPRQFRRDARSGTRPWVPMPATIQPASRTSGGTLPRLANADLNGWRVRGTRTPDDKPAAQEHTPSEDPGRVNCRTGFPFWVGVWHGYRGLAA